MNNLTFPFYNANIIIGEYHAVLFIIPRGVAASDRSPGAVGVPPDKAKGVCLIIMNRDLTLAVSLSPPPPPVSPPCSGCPWCPAG